MSDEMAVTDNVAGDDAKVRSGEVNEDSDEGDSNSPAEQHSEPSDKKPEDSPTSSKETNIQERAEEDDIPETMENNDEKEKEVSDKIDELDNDSDMQEVVNKTEKIDPVRVTVSVKLENVDNDEKSDKENKMDTEEILETKTNDTLQPHTKLKEKVKEEDTNIEEKFEEVKKEQKGVKRRASEVFSDTDVEDFKGFNLEDQFCIPSGYGRILDRLEEEISTAIKNIKPLKNVSVLQPLVVCASKRPRKDTDGSRPSSGMSCRSDEAYDPMSPMYKGRRATTELSSPLLRVPLERGWKRELVYRAALDAQSKRVADIYYYMPSGKKLRSTREVAENLSGTGLTLENFSFFKEPLGLDDPEKEIIRDAKLLRRVESPVPTSAQPAPVEGKRTPKPKPPKGASPEPMMPKSAPAKIKVKSFGLRLSGNANNTPVTSAPKQLRRQQMQQHQQQQSASTPNNTDNNNTAAWKKPRAPEPPGPVAPPSTYAAGASPQPPPPLQSRPSPVNHTSPDAQGGRFVQPCSMSCGRGAVPSLSCAACLCLYHPACAGYHPTHTVPKPFLCVNCLKLSSASSPLPEPPPLMHKSGLSTPGFATPAPRRVPRSDKRVLLRMKVAGGSEGERVWSVSPSSPVRTSPPASPVPSPTQNTAAGARGSRGTLPQFLAQFNGRRFIVVPRTILHAAQQQ